MLASAVFDCQNDFDCVEVGVATRDSSFTQWSIFDEVRFFCRGHSLSACGSSSFRAIEGFCSARSGNNLSIFDGN